MRYYPEVSGPRRRAVLADLVVVALVALFAWLGLTVNDTFDDAAGLGRGVQEAGNSVRLGFEDAGGLLADVPIVGQDLDEAFTDAGAATGGNTAELGEQGESAIEKTALLLGWLTFALPTLAVLLWVVPRRVVRLRRLTAAGRVLAGAHSAERRRALAMRAAFGLPYEALLAHTPDPFGALADGEYDPLLRALFEDAGLRPPSGVAHSPTTSSGATSSRRPR